jgi:hypothetical protein
MKRYKPFKNNYKAGDKIYKLVVYENCCGKLFDARISVNTIKSVVRGKLVRVPIELSMVELKYPDKFGTCVYPEWVAPRNSAGKKFLQNRAKSIIRAKIAQLTKLQKEYRKTLSKFN